MKKYFIFILISLPFIVLGQNKVGINTNTPLYTLDVRGTDDEQSGGELQLSTPSQTDFLRFFGGRLGDRNPFMAFHDLDTFHFISTLPDWSTYTRRMTLLPNGNVGIGLDKPSARLHLKANSTTGYPQIRLLEQGADFARIKMENDANPGVFWDIAGRTDSILENSRLNFYFWSPNGWGDRMTIRGNGKIGIANVNPEATLDVNGGSWNLEGGSPGDLRVGNSTYNLRMSVATGGAGAGASRIFAGGGINALVFGTSNTRRMTIDANGNVGIGLDNPLEKLHVNGAFRVSDLAGTGDRNVIVDSGGKFKIGVLGAGDSDWTETASNVYNNTHNIGIGTANPSTKLQILAPASANGHLRLSIPSSGQFDLSARTMTLGGDNINVEGNIYDDLFLQSVSDGNILMVQGGGNVGIGNVAPPSAKLTVEGFDNDGLFAALEVRTAGNGQVMLLDGNEIDVAGNSTALHLNANTGFPVSIGSQAIATGYMLSVDGKVIAEEMRVQLSGSWPDYVFDDSYNLMPLEEVDHAIKKLGHLPGMPAADQIETEGLDLGDMQKRMMEKIEELTLYVIEQQKEIVKLKELIENK